MEITGFSVLEILHTPYCIKTRKFDVFLIVYHSVDLFQLPT